MNKKIYLGLGTMPLMVFPFLSLASCGLTIDTTSNKINVSAKIVTQQTIDDTIKKYIPTLPEEEKINILSSVFQGIAVTNFYQFDVSITTTPGKITLTAKAGYVFSNGKEILNSWGAGDTGTPSVDLKITPILVEQNTIDQAIRVLTGSNPSDANKISALSTMFNGINDETFKNFDWQVTGVSPTLSVYLTAKDGYTFAGQKNLSSMLLGDVVPDVDLKITPIPSIQSVINTAIESLSTPNSSNINKIGALSKIFNGVNSSNIENFIIIPNKTSGSTPGTVVLSAKDGYTINGLKTVMSQLAQLIDLQVYSKKADQTTIAIAINEYKAALTVEKKVAALSKVFDGITIEKLRNIDIVTVPGTIILTASEGYSFAGKNILTSND